MYQARSCLNIWSKLCRLPIESRFTHKIIKFRHFRTSAIVRKKHFIDKENAFAHGILEQNEKCTVLRGEENIENNQKCVDIDFNQNWSSLTADGVLEHLSMIQSYCKNNGLMISDERFDKFVDVCNERCFDFTDDQLIRSLQILIHYPPTEKPKTRNFVELWHALDHACVERLDKWDFNTILYLCDHWYMLNLGKINEFNWKGSFKVGRKLRKLPPHQLVQTMFYLNVKRSPLLEMFEFETNLKTSLDEFSLNEIAVLCMGFFKTQTRIKSTDLVANIYKRLIHEMDTVQDVTFVCIIKALRLSSGFCHIDLMKQLFEAADGKIHRLSPVACMHLALLGTNIHFCHQSCVEKTIRRLADNVKSLRTKDFERICHVISLFDFESNSQIEIQLCKSILVELKNRVDEIVKHPRSLPLCLHYLSIKGYYDEEIISAVLSRQFLDFGYTNQMFYGKELFGLDSYVKINLKNTYKGNELTERNRQYMGKMLTHYIPKRNAKFRIGATDKILLDLKDTLEELYGHCYFAHALPHFDRPDVIIAYNKSTDTAIDIANNFPELYTGKIVDRSMLIEGLTVNPTDVEVINVIIGGWNNYVTNNKLNGQIKLKMEQSKILGFRSVLIPYYDWERLHKEEWKHYVKHKIASSLQQK